MENDGAAKPELDSEAPAPAAEETSSTTAGEAAAEEEPAKPPSKIFVGGVSWETQDDEFREYFAKFGAMSDCVLMRDRNTGRSRGFGFVTYVKEDSKKAVLSTELTLSGRKLDAKEAVPKGSQQDGENGKRGANGSTKDVKKIFVGALAQETTKEEFDEYFKAYGEVTDSVIMIDKHTGRSRGFGFVSYRDASSVEEVLKHNNHEIHSKRVDCKKATPRGENDGGRGGGGRGGYSTSSPYDWGGGGGWDNGGGRGAYDGWGGGGGSRGGWSGYGDYGGYGGGGGGYGPRWGPSGGGGPPSDHPYYSNRGPTRYRPY